MSAIIEIKNLDKVYGQRKRNQTLGGRFAVRDLNLSIEEGAVFGFIGPNGAGKTTTMRILTTLLEATSGEVRVAGYSVVRNPRGVRRTIGYMPDFFGVYDDMKVWEYLDFFAACYHVPADRRVRMVNDLLELVDLSHRRDDMVDALSRGLKQRLCLARTLVHDPQVLVLDEPASGLDPRARIEIRELLRELSNMGKTIFFSSHILSEVADICTHIGVIENGGLVAAGNIAEMQRRLRPNRIVRVRLLSDPDVAQQVLFGLPDVTNIRQEEQEENQASELLFDFDNGEEELSAILRELVNRNVRVVSFTEETGDLEDVFLQVTQGIVS
ncbi:MAG: ABC transporter ATP-binding protein [Anaerolineales bacterium]|nr:ABC transporter ATP-binding protein [Anaerolineales bacterium]